MGRLVLVQFRKGIACHFSSLSLWSLGSSSIFDQRMLLHNPTRAEEKQQEEGMRAAPEMCIHIRTTRTVSKAFLNSDREST